MAAMDGFLMVAEENTRGEGSERVVQMSELWTEVLDDLLPWYQLWDQHFEAFTGKKLTILGKGEHRFDKLLSSCIFVIQTFLKFVNQDMCKGCMYFIVL